MNLWRFSMTQAWREWRAGEFRSLALALLVATAALTAVNAFGDRMEAALARGANELLGGDLVLRTRFAPEKEQLQQWQAEAEQRDLTTSTTTEFPSVTFVGEESLLVQVKAVTAGYPLRGQVLISDAPFQPGTPAAGIPGPGEAWVETRALTQLQAGIGDTLELGDLQLNITALVTREPDRGSGLFNLAPRVMINQQDLAASGLTGEGSRLRWRLLVAGEANELASWRAWMDERLQPGQRFISLEESQQQVSGALDRARRFLSLAALSAVLLAGVAIVLSVREFTQRHLDTVAILRCLGQRSGTVLRSYALQLLAVALPVIITGVMLGYLTQFGLVWALGDLLPEELPLPGWGPAFSASLTGLITLAGFGLPPLAVLRYVPPMRVLNRQLDQVTRRLWPGYLVATLFAVALVLWQAGDLRLGLSFVGVMLGGTALLAGSAWLLLRGLRRLTRSQTVGWRYGLAALHHRGAGALLQIAGLGLGGLALLLLGVVQADLLRGWRDSMPEQAPNYFLINIQPAQRQAVAEYLEQHGLASQGLFPMVTGRLAGINGERPGADDFDDPDAERRLNGTVNFSWSDELPRGNRLLLGDWWQEHRNGPQVSLEQDWARALNLEVGDVMDFSVGATEFSAEVRSIREVAWDSFEVNFFILLSPDLPDTLPHTYISSLYVTEQQVAALTGIARQWPNVSLLDVGIVLDRVRNIIERVSLAVQFVFAFTLLAGAAVLAAGIRASQRERLQEAAVMRALGGSRQQLRRAVLAEFSILGACAGLLAALGAMGAGAWLAHGVFDISYTPQLWLPLAGAIAGGIGVGLAGLSGNRRVLTVPPMVVLRTN